MSDNLYNQEHSKTYDIPLNHFDFKYIRECGDIVELEKIMKTLKSGEVGVYKELESCCEERIRSINPNSRVLRKAVPLGRLSDLDAEERNEVEKGLQDWREEMEAVSGDIVPGGDNKEDCARIYGNYIRTDETQKEPDDRTIEYEVDLPPVRREMVFKPNSVSALRPHVDEKPFGSGGGKKPRDYSEWDKLEKEWDKELEEDEKQTVSQAQSKEMSEKKAADDSDTFKKMSMREFAERVRNLPESERRQLAIREKEKGNEAFQAKDYSEALAYYKRSLKIFPTNAVHNNRALVYLHMKRWSDAVRDCNQVLKEEPNNLKALFRSGRANYELHNLDRAEEHLERLTDQDPANTKAQNLLRSVRAEKAKRQRAKHNGGRRLVITDVGSSSESSDSESETPEASGCLENPKENTPPASVPPSSKKHTEEAGDKPIADQTTLTCEKPTDALPDPVVGMETKNEMLSQSPDPNKNRWSASMVGVVGSVEKQPTDNPSSVTPLQEVDGSSSTNEVHEENNESLPARACFTEKTKPLNTTEEIKRKTSSVEIEERFVKDFEKFKECGKQALEKGSYALALEHYSKCTELVECHNLGSERSAMAYRNRAMVYLQSGNYELAVEDCTKALSHEPESPVALYRRALGLRYLEQYERSLMDLKEAHRLRPDSRNIMNELKRVEKQVAHQKALTQKAGLQTAARLSPDGRDDYEVVDLQLSSTADAKKSVSYSGDKTIDTEWEVVSPSTTAGSSRRVQAHEDVATDESKLEAEFTLDYLVHASPPCNLTAGIFQTRWTNLRTMSSVKRNKEIICLLHDTGISRLTEVIGLKLDAAMLDQIAEAVNWISTEQSHTAVLQFAYDLLLQLSKIPRFDCALFLLEDKTIQAINNVLNKFSQLPEKKVTHEEVEILTRIYDSNIDD